MKKINHQLLIVLNKSINGCQCTSLTSQVVKSNHYFKKTTKVWRRPMINSAKRNLNCTSRIWQIRSTGRVFKLGILLVKAPIIYKVQIICQSRRWICNNNKLTEREREPTSIVLCIRHRSKNLLLKFSNNRSSNNQMLRKFNLLILLARNPKMILFNKIMDKTSKYSTNKLNKKNLLLRWASMMFSVKN